ncbi:MAG TPA: PEGA domain-containing protein [Candidatus Nitrosotalea sp.]|nr:PEGA domain-containing protein [Candidatus Nitrosotalea sp.]
MDGFGSYVVAAFRVKGVPVVVVANRAVADYEVVGNSDSQKAGWAKVIFLKQTGSREEASISVVDLRTSEVVFAYNYNTGNSYRGKQSAAESCAKHLAEAIRKGGRFASSLPPLTEQQVAASRARDQVPNSTVPPSNPASPSQAEEPKTIIVRFNSTPTNAEVQVDGEYWGSTPTAELTRLPAGSHTIVVKRIGYQPWERKITLAPGDDRTISAELQAQPIDPTKPRIVGN